MRRHLRPGGVLILSTPYHGYLKNLAISLFGVAGIGGGATLAALIVLPALGFPVALVALLISTVNGTS